MFVRPGIQVVLNTTARYSDSFKLYGHHPKKNKETIKSRLTSLARKKNLSSFFHPNIDLYKYGVWQEGKICKT